MGQVTLAVSLPRLRLCAETQKVEALYLPSVDPGVQTRHQQRCKHDCQMIKCRAIIVYDREPCLGRDDVLNLELGMGQIWQQVLQGGRPTYQSQNKCVMVKDLR